MAFKVKTLIVALACVSAISAGVIPTQKTYQGPMYIKQSKSPEYKFSYAVNDEHTGDVKSQVETRDGDVVHGEYSLVDADGFKRIVQYSADPEHGFNAVVKRQPLNHTPAQIIKAVSVTHTAPAPVIYTTASTLFKSAPSTYATVPTQGTNVRQSYLKSAIAAKASAPARGSNDKQSLNKNSPRVHAAHQVQFFEKSVPVAHVGNPTYHERQSTIKPVNGAYVRQINVKSVPPSYGSRSSNF